MSDPSDLHDLGPGPPLLTTNSIMSSPTSGKQLLIDQPVTDDMSQIGSSRMAIHVFRSLPLLVRGTP